MASIADLDRSNSVDIDLGGAEFSPDMDFPGGLGILAPARTPPDVVSRLAAAMKVAVHAPAVVEKMKALTVEPLGTSPEEFGKYIRAEFIKFGKAAQSANLKKE